jgi:mannose-1-phosphate guanylyltransferase
MKAFLLAAGAGTRLRPITNTTPKCLLPIAGRPLLDLWLDALAAAGVDEVLVNLHHLAANVRRHLDSRRAPPSVRPFFEPELLGSAGTLRANRGWVEGEELFLACNADNLTDFELSSLIEFHERGNEVASLTVFHAEQPEACGVVELDRTNRMVGFVEKPRRPVCDLANAGMYAFHSSVLDEIEGSGPLDIGYHLLPRLVGRARAMVVEGYFRDIGTPEAYRQAMTDFPLGARQ